MTILLTIAQLDQLNLETSEARDKAVFDYKIPLIKLRNKAKEDFSDDPQAARALRCFEESASAVTPAGMPVDTQADLEITRGVIACHIREVIEEKFHQTAKQLTDTELCCRYESNEVSEWEKLIIEGHFADRFEEQLREEGVYEEILENMDEM